MTQVYNYIVNYFTEHETSNYLFFHFHQVLSPCGNKFIDATPVKNAIVFNVGDLLQIWSQRKLKSTLHQVVIPEDMIRLKKSRQSIVFFTNPDNDYVIKTVDANGNIDEKCVGDHIAERNNTTIFDVKPQSDNIGSSPHTKTKIITAN